MSESGIEKKATWSAFVEELEKISVSLTQLRGIAKRIGAKKMPKEIPYPGGLTVPKPGVSRAVMISQGVNPRSVKKLLREQNTVLKDWGVREGVYLEPRAEQFRQMLGAPKRTSRGLRDITAAHEQFERRIPVRQVAPGFSHASPDVLAQEHNLLATLKGKRGKELSRYLRKIRSQTGEGESLSRTLQERFGSRAAIQYGKGQKIPKAMRKRLVTTQKGKPITSSAWGSTKEPSQQEAAMGLFLSKAPQNPAANRARFFSK